MTASAHPAGIALGNSFEAAWNDPAAVLVLLVFAAAAFGAAYDARKHWKERAWSARAVWNAVAAGGIFLVALAWAVWLARTGPD